MKAEQQSPHGEETLPAERRDRILELLSNKGRVVVTRDSERLGISRSTLHRDLGELSRLGLIKRIRGGAVASGAKRFDQRFNVRLGINADAKRQIARACVAEISDDMSIFLDHSSTCFYVAEALAKMEFRTLVVVSNSMAVAELLGDKRGIEMLLTGGKVETEFRALSGRPVIDFISTMNLNHIFLSCRAVSVANGLMTQVPFIRDLIQGILALGRPVNLLVDSNKFDASATFSIAPLSPQIRIFTDEGTPVSRRAELAKKDVELVG